MRGKSGFFRSCFGGCTACVKYEADDFTTTAREAPDAVLCVKKTRDVGTMAPHSDSLVFRDEEDAAVDSEQLKKCGDVEETTAEALPKHKTSTAVVLDSSAPKRGSSSGSAFEERSSLSSASSVGEVDQGAEKSSKRTSNVAAGEAAPPQATRSRKGGRLHHSSDVTNAATSALIEAAAGEGAPRHPSRVEALSCHPILTREWSLPSSITSDEEVEGEGHASDYE